MVTTQNIDYLRCSFDAPLFVVQELVKDVLGSTWVETRGKNFYRSGRTAPCGAELWTDGFAQCMGTCLDMSGLSCAAVEDMRGFIGVLLRAGARFSRIDTALDVFDGPVTYDLIVDAMKADSVVSRARKDARDVGNYNPYTGAWKVTMGGRSSDSYLRIYNKAAEQRIDANWVRFELELKRENSQAMAMAYAYGDLENDPFIMRSICALFDVREGTQQSLYARPRVAWMEQVFSSRILAGVRNTLDIMRQKIRQLETVPIIRSSLAYLREQSASMLAAYEQVCGRAAIDELLAEGRRRWKSRHKVLMCTLESRLADIGGSREAVLTRGFA